MTEDQGKKFEDYIDVIELAIRKQRSRWRLDCIAWFDFEDVEQVIKLHIYKKWSMWNQDLPLEPWINTIVTNQIRNLVRNHYGNYVKPCVNCNHNLGGDGCSFTKSGLQDGECFDFSKWSKTKKVAFELKVSVPSENHLYEMGKQPSEELHFDDPVKKLNVFMKKELSELHYKAYYMLFFELTGEEEVAKLMGYKTNEKKRKAGYRQVKNLKKLFLKTASDIIRKEDIIITGME